MSEPILSLKGLTKRFGGLTAVNNVSWDIAPGEVLALLGDNGAGKSTLIKCVSGVYQPDEGEMWFGGEKRSFTNLEITTVKTSSALVGKALSDLLEPQCH